jgi:hypothetical protein
MKPCLVYRNLNKRCWSVKFTGLPVCHFRNLTMFDCVFIVRQGGRERVLSENRKNVHAFVKGQLGHAVAEQFEAATYNPYRSGTFYLKDNGQSVVSADAVRFEADGSMLVSRREYL